MAEKPAENKAEKAAETKAAPAAETKAAPAVETSPRVDIIAMERAGDVVYIADELVAAFERQGYTKKETK